MGDLVRKDDRRARPRITCEIINKTDEQKSGRMSEAKNGGRTRETLERN
jgi:hypothetical protein